jgi:ABC-type transport system involved in cytochrome c biogenesis permease component
MAIVDLTGALFGVVMTGDLPRLFATLILGTVGLASVGSLLGVLTEAARAREAVFPLLVLPLTTPVLIASIDRAGVG